MMHHILESSVSLQLPDVFGEICSHVDTDIFSLGEEESTKKFSLIFQTPKMKAGYPARPSKGSLWVPWRVHEHWQSHLLWPPGLNQGLLLLHPHERGRVRELQRQSCQGAKLAEQLQLPFKPELMDIDNIIRISLQFSRWPLSPLIGCSLQLLLSLLFHFSISLLT